MGETVLTCSCNLICYSLRILWIFKTVFLFIPESFAQYILIIFFFFPNFLPIFLHLSIHPTSYHFLLKQTWSLVGGDWPFLIMAPFLQYGWCTQCHPSKNTDFHSPRSCKLWIASWLGVWLSARIFSLARVYAEKLKAFPQNQGQVEGIHSSHFSSM